MARCKIYKKKRKKRLIVLSVFLLLGLGVYFFLSQFVYPVIRTVSREYVRSAAIDSVNKSVGEVMDNNPYYVNLTKVEHDAAGNITMIYADSAAVNSLARNVTQCAQNNLSSIGEEGIKIPLGSLSGISFLAGRGPDLNIRAVQVGNIDTSFKSEFVSQGVNQTLHKLFIEVSASVNIIIPGAENKVTTVTSVLVSESIIIGKVPDVYLSGDASGLVYNLVP